METKSTFAELFGTEPAERDTTPHSAKIARDVYNDVYRAMAGDKFAMIRIQGDYPEVKTLGDLNTLGSKMFEQMTDEMKAADLAELTK